jgi:hypothetical protein
MRGSSILAALLFLASSSALAQDDLPKVETSSAFMFIRNSPNFTHAFSVNGATVSGSNYFNCAGGGATLAYNVTRMFGVAAGLGGCRCFGNTVGLGDTITGNQFTYLFGPRLTLRNRTRFTPFFNLGFGGDRLSLNCNSSAANCLSAFGSGTYTKSAFALTAGGGFDSNRRVDITLSTTGQESVRHFPFNAADSLSLIGGREAAKKKTATPAEKGIKRK